MDFNRNATSELWSLAARPVEDFFLLKTTLLAFGCGVLTILTSASIYILVQKGLRRLPTQLLLAATIILYASTCVFLGFTLAYINTVFTILNKLSVRGLLAPSYTMQWDDWDAVAKAMSRQQFAMSSALLVNMFVCDAIGWWRALAVWPGNKLVRIAGGVLLTATLVLASIAAFHSSVPLVVAFNMIVLDPVQMATMILSLSTNAVSTLVIAYKAWTHWRFLREHIRKTRGSRALAALALLVESGVAYCLLWVVLIAFYIWTMDVGSIAAPAAIISTAEAVIFVLPVPLIAIYPLTVIVLVTLHKSALENASARAALTLPTAAFVSAASRTRALSAAGVTSTVVFTRARESVSTLGDEDRNAGFGGGEKNCVHASGETDACSDSTDIGPTIGYPVSDVLRTV